MNSAHNRGIERLLSHPLIEKTRDEILRGGILQLSGLKGPISTFILAILSESVKQPVVVVLSDDDEIDSFLKTMRVFTRNRDLYPYPFAPPQLAGYEHAQLTRQMKGLRAMMEGDAARGIWITSPEALSSPCFSLDFIDQPTLLFEPGLRIELGALRSGLEQRGFSFEDKVDQKGDAAVRGGILDIYPHFALHPVRIEFLGDEIDTIREFSAITQRSIRQLTRFVLDDLDEEKMQDLSRTQQISDYIPPETIFFVQNPDTQNPESGLRFFPEGTLGWDEESPRFRSVGFGASLENAQLHFEGSLLDPDGMSLDGAVGYLLERQKGRDIFLVADYGSTRELAAREGLESWSLEGRIEQSFELPCLNIEVYDERHLVQISELIAPSGGKAMDDFIELELGDHVVHEKYGIGQYLGLHSLERDGEEGDHLLLQFKGMTKIYVSVSQLHLVQKYLGRDGVVPELSKIGTQAWEMKKRRARGAIDRVVMELVRRQALRQEQTGFGFSPDSSEQRAFERRFPYTETPCQLSAIHRIKQDMVSAKPMDHLLCGDVGFGKTEVAMRAAHKAIMDGKQVAVLAPTTILAEQHYHTFAARFADKSSLIGVVSRFKTPREKAKALAAVAEGEVMILIGTHRILSSDVEFADLGLLILDEEQRFGVKQKEILKKRFPSIDVLSLSATPIPRTLHLSLLGLRNISNLTVSPENRLAIRTYVRRFDRGIIKHAIKRELERGGQAYFLHNRVETILSMKAVLTELFPEARIGVGHGQMPEKELSKVMQDFYDGAFDILLASSIIANGIDLPTANT
ncbi:MAG: DEAD/DEAH box helicase, partial [Planctomycetes bacterium]|nr:DEAD/DEAH box helicase [Planctomycetota bacterium]